MTEAMTLQGLSRFRSLTDAQIIGEAKQSGDAFVNRSGTYEWYFALAAAKAPQRILELGVRYGYGLLAMAKGADAAGVRAELAGIDAEADGIPSNDIALKNLWPHADTIRIFKLNTQDPDAVNAALVSAGRMDMVHIDGDHSERGIRNELYIALSCAKTDALILVDDTDTPHIRAFYEQTCATFGIPTLYVPTVHWLGVIDLRHRTSY